MTLLLFYLFIAIFVSFLCSILEAVLLSISPAYIESIDDKYKYKKVLKKLKDNLDSAISAILILNTFAHTIGAAGVGAEAVKIFGVKWQGLIALILTLLILYFSEIIPKTIGAVFWKELAKSSTYLILFLTKILAPLIWISDQITKRLRGDKKFSLSRAEIAAMAELGEKSGSLEEQEGQLIENLLKLKEVKVKDILTPRGVVFTLDASRSIKSVLKEKDIFTFSRIPIYEDKEDNITDMVFAKKILKATSLDEGDDKPIKTISNSVHRVSENLPVYYLMDIFIKRKEHLFIVHDKYEQYVGIVTLEDAIETLLGVEIVDEADTVVDMQELARRKALSRKQPN